MDSTIAAKLESYDWPYADQDQLAFNEIARRVANAGRRRVLVTHSELVKGLTFHIPSVNNGQPFEIGRGEWTDLHRAIVGDFLGRLCAETHPRGDFMGSALVVSSDGQQPSEGFRKFMRTLGALKTRSEDEFLRFWTHQVNRAYEWYATNDW